MIRLCIFDMGGVVIRDFNVARPLLAFLGRSEASISGIDPRIRDALLGHNVGAVSEEEFWNVYAEATGSVVPADGSSLLARFFNPTIDGPTVELIEELKARGLRVVCGTNVIDGHYRKHLENDDYRCFQRVYASHLMGAAKPDPVFYERILEAEGVAPSEAFFTDDAAENAEAAAALGIAAYRYDDARGLRARLVELGLLS